MHVGAETTSITYNVTYISSQVKGTFTHTVDGTTKYVTAEKTGRSGSSGSGGQSYRNDIVTVTGGSNGEGTNTISSTFTPSSTDYIPNTSTPYSTNYNSVTVTFSATAVQTYTVSYNANGGSGAPASQIKVKGTNLTLSSTVPTREGFAFQGWATSSTATSATYSAGGSYTTNSGATLFAVWKDIQPPTLGLHKWTYQVGVPDGTYSYGIGFDSTGNEVYLTEGALETTRTVSGGHWYLQFDAYTVNSTPVWTPNGGIYAGLAYTSYDQKPMAEKFSGNDYTGNGWAYELNLNTWTTVQIDYGRPDGPNYTGFDNVTFWIGPDGNYSYNPSYLKNIYFWAENMHNSFYRIYATFDDNVGVSTIKYISGDVGATTCINSGTSMNYDGGIYYVAQVTSNATYTVCVSDLEGNVTSKTIVIDKIGNPKSIGPYSKIIPSNISSLYYTFDGSTYLMAKKDVSQVILPGFNYVGIPAIFNNNNIINNLKGVKTIQGGTIIRSQTNAFGNELKYSKVNAGNNSYNIIGNTANRWISIEFFAGCCTPNLEISSFKITINNETLTIEQAINKGYISPFVVVSQIPYESPGYINYIDMESIIKGTTTSSSSWPVTRIQFKVLNYNMTSVQFTSNVVWGAEYLGWVDGLAVFILPEKFDFSLHPFNSKFWTDSWSDTLYPEGQTPSGANSTTPATQGWGKVFIRTLEDGRHETCIRNMYSSAEKNPEAEVTFCIGKNYWDTDGETTRQKLVDDYKLQTGHDTGGSWTNGTSSSSIQQSAGGGVYDCGADPTGSVTCRYQFKSGSDWYDSSSWANCTIYGNGSARCYKGAVH